jgi:hypothetical protein
MTKTASGRRSRDRGPFQEIADDPDQAAVQVPLRPEARRPPVQRGQCAGSARGARRALLLVGKVNPKTKKLEIIRCLVESPKSGDTMVIG